jgi:magnesium transporter
MVGTAMTPSPQGIENSATYMTAGVLWGVDLGMPEIAPIAFVLTNKRLITVRYADPRVFKMITATIQIQSNLCNSGVRTLVTLLEAIIDRTAEVLQKVGDGVGQVAKDILERNRRAKKKLPSPWAEGALDAISTTCHMTVKVRESLVSLGRVIGFLALVGQVPSDKEARDQVKGLARDAASLMDHATFIGVYAPSGERGGELARKGFDLISIGTDNGFLRAGAQAALVAAS